MLSPFLEWNIIFGCLECIRHVVKESAGFICLAEACTLSLVSSEALVSAAERSLAAALIGTAAFALAAVVAPAPTVEEIEDKALAAIQSVKATVEEGVAQIMEAKAAPAATTEPEIQEAQFSETEKTFSDAGAGTLITWLNWTKQ